MAGKRDFALDQSAAIGNHGNSRRGGGEGALPRPISEQVAG
jgi:hypothetical protein